MKEKRKIEDKIKVIENAIRCLELNNKENSHAIQIFEYKEKVKLLKWVLD